jgi:hypothetical protein
LASPFFALLVVLSVWITLLLAMTASEPLLSLRRWRWRGTAVADESSEVGQIPSLSDAIAEVVIEQRPFQIGRVSGWRETNRKVTARPFILLLDDGRRVRVEIGTSAQVACRLEPVGAKGAAFRHGTLNVGDRVLVDGEMLAESGGEPGPYRGSPARYFLRCRANHPLWLASEFSLQRHARHLLVLNLCFGFLGLLSAILLARGIATLSWPSTELRLAATWLVVLAEIGAYAFCRQRIRPWYQRRKFNNSRYSYLASLAD